MGPTNVALVKLFRADQALREAQERLDVATKNVRVQDRRVNDVAERLKLAQAKHLELQARSGNLDLDLRSRDAHIEKLRTQQQATANAREYQTFLVEINTMKVDKAKVEEQAMAVMQEAETAGKEVSDLTAQVGGERSKAASLKTEIGETISRLQAEIDSLKGPRETVAATLPPKARTAFERLAEHHDGEALAALVKPDRRKEEYSCAACMMSLVTDIYNKLHTRDDLVYCSSCRRILYIPEELPPDMAVNKKKPGGTSTRGGGKGGKAADGDSSQSTVPRVKEAPRAKGRLGEILAAAQGESVKNAVDADQKPMEFHVTIDGKVVGIYKAKNADNFERIIRFRLDEAGLKQEVHVNPVVQAEEKPVPDAAAAPAEPATAAVTESVVDEPVETV